MKFVSSEAWWKPISKKMKTNITDDKDGKMGKGGGETKLTVSYAG